MRSALIELDEPASTPQPDRRRPPAARGLRLLLVSVLALAVTASTPAHPLLRQVTAVAFELPARFWLTTDRLYVGQDFGVGAGQVVAYALPSGRRVWTAVLPNLVAGVALAASGGVVVVSSNPAEGRPAAVTVLAATTGRVLWRRAGVAAEIVTGTPQGLLLFTAVPTTGAHNDLSLVDPVTGQPHWTYLVPPDGYLVGPQPLVPGDPLVVALPRHAVVLVDLATGAARSVPLPELSGWAGPAPDLGPPSYSVVDTTLYAGYTADGYLGGGYPGGGHPGGDVTWLAAYDLTAGVLRWLVPVPAGASTVSDCGPVRCVGNGGLVLALDPGSGVVRWRTNSWSVLAAAGNHLLVTITDLPSLAALWSALDGRALLDLPRWSLVDYQGGTGLLIAYRGDQRDAALALLNVATATLTYLGRLDRIIATACRLQSGYLACPTFDGTLRVLRYQPERAVGR